MLRKSRKRDRILELIRGTTCHPTAEWVYLKLKDEMPELSLATVYRNLEQLTKCGELLKLPGDTAHFDGNTSAHHHLTCDECRMVFDLPIPYDADFTEKIMNNSKFIITGYTIDFRGICPSCRDKNSENR